MTVKTIYRLKDVLTRELTVHGLWYIVFFFGSRMHPFTVMKWVQKLYALTVMVNPFQGNLSFRIGSDKWRWTRRVEYCIVSVTGFTYQAIRQFFSSFIILAVWSLLTGRRSKLYLLWIQCSRFIDFYWIK